MQIEKKKFDCVQMKHDIQREVYEETKDLSTAELIEYFRRASEAFQNSQKRGAKPGDLRAFLDTLDQSADKRAG